MAITREQWQQVKTIALEAWDRPASERIGYVTDACGADASLLREVESLLASMGAAGSRFETPSLLIPSTDAALRGVVDLPPLAAASGRIGGWRILRPLGSGGMGTVYLAERADAGFTQRAAIKLARGGFGDALLRQRFLEERRILATLEHPDIARLIDGGTTEDGAPYVVMEFVDGVPIDTFCNDRGLGMRERLELFRRVCAVVHYAHQRLVVHRDLKAANILVTADGTPKLLDFGIAKLLDSSAEATQTVLRMVTPESASPEQIQGATITTATDVYALGVLLYRLLTAENPYGSGRSETDLIRAVCEETPRPPSAVARDRIPADVDVIVMKALRKEPERRYGSVDQLSDDLRRYLEGRPVHAAPDSAAYRAGKFVRRHRLAVAAAAAIVITVLAGIGATLWQARVARRERERADANRARAERQFSAVRGLANAVLGELHDAVVALPGSIKAREVLLRRATEYLDTLRQEAAGDPELTRELARGYIRLAQVQGGSGLPNLGDRLSAVRNYREALSLLESTGGLASKDPQDRISLADTYVRLTAYEEEPATRQDLLQRARETIEAVRAEGHVTIRVLSVTNVVWTAISEEQRDRKDLAGAEASLRKATEASEAAFRLEPTNPSLSRNLSLNHKTLGAVIQNMGRFDEALALYDKAMVLDTERVTRQPQHPFWKLDLSFTYGSIASVLANKSDRRALEYADKAVALREEAVALDPDEDFAKGALARGYDRQGNLRAWLGNLPGAIDAQMKRIAIYDKRLEEHPDRENFLREYNTIAFDAASTSMGYLEKTGSAAALRRQAAQRIDTVLAKVRRIRSQWIADKRAGTIGPSQDDLDRAIARCQTLMK
jgi:non-specific serine/threonine protein kinase/serine/threonine-protein kinase